MSHYFTLIKFTLVFCLVMVSGIAHADQEEMKKAMEFFSTAGIPGNKWTEGETMYPHVLPASHFNATMLYYPGTEELQPDEVRVTFMGSTYYPNQSQSGMSIFVELGNGDNFVFDLGIGSLRNYNSFSIPLNVIDKVFITHLHMDHISDLPYFMIFRGIQGGWTPIHIYGPSGSEPQYGTAYYVENMMKMTAWHQDSFNAWPIGEGYDPVVHEFNYMNEGGVIYNKDGVQIKHWPTSHTKDGASSYRLDWKGRSICFTGDNRPNSLTIKYCKGVDMLISEVQTAAVSLSSMALGMPPAMAAYTIDTSHTPAYGLGYICKKAKPKVCVATHYSYDDVFNNETVAEIREHWKGAFAFGAPDLVTFNIHGDGKVWWREGVAADSSQTPRPLFESEMIRFPAPRHQVYDVINDTIEANEIDPKLWYPKGHKPELVREWPIKTDLNIPNPFAAPAKKGK
ncbi:MAG: guanitoxin biosynthesis MBL fold metallo-hydrolase GntH [Thermodesulfobacteriota bacterium]